MRREFRVGWIAAVVWACSSSPESSERPQACTLIGCENGLGVRIEGATGQVRVTLETDGRVEIREVGCDPGRPCGVFFAGRTPEWATIRVVAGGDTVGREVRPEYETVQPNGPGCPPVCRQATVTVVLPGD